MGKGVLKAVENVNTIIAPALIVSESRNGVNPASSMLHN